MWTRYITHEWCKRRVFIVLKVWGVKMDVWARTLGNVATTVNILQHLYILFVLDWGLFSTSVARVENNMFAVYQIHSEHRPEIVRRNLPPLWLHIHTFSYCMRRYRRVAAIQTLRNCLVFATDIVGLVYTWLSRLSMRPQARSCLSRVAPPVVAPPAVLLVNITSVHRCNKCFHVLLLPGHSVWLLSLIRLDLARLPIG